MFQMIPLSLGTEEIFFPRVRQFSFLICVHSSLAKDDFEAPHQKLLHAFKHLGGGETTPRAIWGADLLHNIVMKR